MYPCTAGMISYCPRAAFGITPARVSWNTRCSESSRTFAITAIG